MNYTETLHDLHQTPRRTKEEHLHRMERLLHHLGHPEVGRSIIHIAGTNGKGSVAKMLYKILSEGGYNTGLFTSPYIFDFRERIISGAKKISESAVVKLYKKVKVAGKITEGEGFGYPSEFELVTAMALLYFSEEKSDPILLEVGIGGRFDATNVITPMLSLVTSINYDHMNLLGHTLESIAKHKAGIIKGAPAIAYFQYPEAEAVLRAQAAKTGAPLRFIRPRDMMFLEQTEKGQRVRYHPEGKSPMNIHLSLLGVHQIQNLNLVLCALEELHGLGYPVSKEATFRALKRVRWPGRMEILSHQPLILIDGAHNQDGAVSLRESIAFYYPKRPILLILGMLGDKNVDEVATILSKGTKKSYCITPEDPRGLPAEVLAGYIHKGIPVEVAASPQDAIRMALRDCQKEDLILIAGSLYIISDMERALNEVVHLKP